VRRAASFNPAHASLDEPAAGCSEQERIRLDLIDRSLQICRSLGIEDVAGPSTQVDRSGYL
jgi:hypothetical protein